ncbi:MAG: hypothetical protein IKH57_16305 [Clostridia bacterium]|nr:hypothetical protein [Clostridia bacterium]
MMTMKKKKFLGVLVSLVLVLGLMLGMSATGIRRGRLPGAYGFYRQQRHQLDVGCLDQNAHPVRRDV